MNSLFYLCFMVQYIGTDNDGKMYFVNWTT